MLPTESVDGIPPQFPIGLYEELVAQLSRSGMFENVWRQGEGRSDSDVLMLYVDIPQVKQGSALFARTRALCRTNCDQSTHPANRRFESSTARQRHERSRTPARGKHGCDQTSFPENQERARETARRQANSLKRNDRVIAAGACVPPACSLPIVPEGVRLGEQDYLVDTASYRRIIIGLALRYPSHRRLLSSRNCCTQGPSWRLVGGE